MGTILFNMAVNPVSGERLRLEHGAANNLTCASRGPAASRSPRRPPRCRGTSPSARVSVLRPDRGHLRRHAAPPQQAHRLLEAPHRRPGPRGSHRRRTTAWRRPSTWRSRATARRSTWPPSAPGRSASSPPAALEADTFDPTARRAPDTSCTGGGPTGLVARRGAQPPLRADTLRQRGLRPSTSALERPSRASRCTTRSRPAWWPAALPLRRCAHLGQRRGVVLRAVTSSATSTAWRGTSATRTRWSSNGEQPSRVPVGQRRGRPSTR